MENSVFMQAHWFSFFIIFFSLAFVNVFWFWVLPIAKAKTMATFTIFLEALLLTACFFDITKVLGLLGGPFIILLWLTPATLVWFNKAFFRNLDQRYLVSLQIFRLIGGLFILEMFRGKIPASFALPAGIGDILVGLTALLLVTNYKKIPNWGVVLVLVLGILDFASALFFGYGSLPGPAQLFAFGFNNQANLFPTGIIPLFLVPYAIVFHTISYINLKQNSKN